MFNTKLFGNRFVNCVYTIKFYVFFSEKVIETKLNLFYRKQSMLDQCTGLLLLFPCGRRTYLPFVPMFTVLTGKLFSHCFHESP